jgi:hypothetical protein
MPGRHTRRNPSGPLLSPEKLAEVEKANRGKRANERWDQVRRDMGPITARNFDRQFAYYKLLGNPKALKAEQARIDHMLAHQGVDGGPTPRRRGGRTRRARMSRRR